MILGDNNKNDKVINNESFSKSHGIRIEFLALACGYAEGRVYAIANRMKNLQVHFIS